MFQIPSADRVRVHRVYADDACRLVLTSDARLVCPVHSGVARPRSRRRCEIRSFHLCQVCMREQVPRRNFKDMQRYTCADCLDIDREIAAASGVGPLTGIVQKESMTRRGAAHVTLAFPDLWQSAVEAGLAVFVLDENAPYATFRTRVSVSPAAAPDVIERLWQHGGRRP